MVKLGTQKCACRFGTIEESNIGPNNNTMVAMLPPNQSVLQEKKDRLTWWEGK